MQWVKMVDSDSNWLTGRQDFFSFFFSFNMSWALDDRKQLPLVFRIYSPKFLEFNFYM